MHPADPRGSAPQHGQSEQSERPGQPGTARVTLRPIGTPLPLGFLGLFVASLAFSVLHLGWVPTTQGHTVALAILALTVPVQLIACILGFSARDPVAGTGMGLQAGAWAATCLATLTSPPGATSAGLGVVLVAAGAAMLVPAAAGRAKTLAAITMSLSGARFSVSGIADLTGSSGWLNAAGWVGLGLAVVSLYAALAFELEGSESRAVLPLWRRGAAEQALTGTAEDQLAGIAHEPGVRKQL